MDAFCNAAPCVGVAGSADTAFSFGPSNPFCSPDTFFDYPWATATAVPPAAVTGPLPILGAAAALGYRRERRKCINGPSSHPSRSGSDRQRVDAEELRQHQGASCRGTPLWSCGSFSPACGVRSRARLRLGIQSSPMACTPSQPSARVFRRPAWGPGWARSCWRAARCWGGYSQLRISDQIPLALAPATTTPIGRMPHSAMTLSGLSGSAFAWKVTPR